MFLCEERDIERVRGLRTLAMLDVMMMEVSYVSGCNRAREEYRSSKRIKGIEEINEKKLTYVEGINVHEVQKDNHNRDHL